MLIIFHHLAKNAGTSIRSILKQNYTLTEYVELYGPNRDTVEWYSNWYRNLTPEQGNQIQCIAAHTAHFIIPVLQQPYHAFCLLRNPVDRMISLYYFVLTLANQDQGRGSQIGKKIRQLNWKIEDIYLNLGNGAETDSELHETFKFFFNGQVRTLLAPHTNTNNLAYTSAGYHPSYDTLLDNVLENYTVGTQENFSESVQHFAQQFGWKQIELLHTNPTLSRPKTHDIPHSVKNLIEYYNQLDMKLYQRVAITSGTVLT